MEEAKHKSPKQVQQALKPNSRFSIPDLAEGAVEQLDGFVHIRLGGIQHGREAESIAVEAAFADEQAILARALHHLCGGFGGGFFRLAVLHEFERLHESHAANVANERILRLQLFEFAPEIFS